jgi:phage terminase Nu1 subunit (DNA packaging protein)
VSEPQRFQGNHRETAQLLGISEEALRKAVINRGCPVLEQGGAGRETIYSWPAVIAWRMQDVMPNDLSVERARLAKEQADRTGMENEVRRGRLADVDDVEREWQDMVLACRAKLLGIPRKLAAQLTNVADPHDIEDRITTEIHTALVELADDDGGSGSAGPAPERDGQVAATAEADRQPVGGSAPEAF